MTTPEDDVTVIDPAEGKAMLERMKRERAERMAYLKRFGYTSGEGFYIDEDGKPPGAFRFIKFLVGPPRVELGTNGL